jgi:hypothetical protein
LLGRFERVRNPAVDVNTPPTADTAPHPLIPQPTWAEITSCTSPYSTLLYLCEQLYSSQFWNAATGYIFSLGILYSLKLLILPDIFLL